MGMKHRDYLVSETGRVYGCSVCKTHLATYELIISKAFTGQHGRAYLFEHVVNVTEGEADNRSMTTGLHTVRDITCSRCDNLLGWKYDKAFDTSQAYKEGKFILEKQRFVQVE